MAKESWASCAVQDVDTKADESEYRDPQGFRAETPRPEP
jgi:hypothetical protein